MKKAARHVREHSGRERLMKAARKAAGSLADAEIPGWETSESAVEWVRAARRRDEEKVRRLWEQNEGKAPTKGNDK